MTPLFRPTVWPGGEVPLPQVPVRTFDRLDDGWLLFRGQPRLVDVPPDFYLREMGAQVPQTDDDIAVFVKQWGRCTDHDYRDRPLGMAWARQTVDYVLRYGPRPSKHSSSGGVATIREVIADDIGGGVVGWRDLVHIEEIKDRLEASSWLAKRFVEWQTGVEREEKIWELFAEQLNAALSAFSVHISIGPRSVVLPRITAFSVAALQLVNDLAAETPVRRCGNERCPVQVFTRQRGRSQYGQHRTAGIKYCSNSCARAQGERERRRRNSKGNQ